MSKLGKILFYAALAGAVVAAIFGGLLVEKRSEDKTLITQTQQARLASDKAAAQARQETASVTQAKTESDSKLATATSQIEDLNTQLTSAK